MLRFAQSLLVASLVAIIAPIALAADPANDHEAIRQRLHEWRQAFNARNAAGACDLFAPGLTYAVPGIPQGNHETMCGNFKKLFEKPGLTLSYAEPAIHEIFTSGEIGVVRLTWTLTTEVDGKQETSIEEGLDVFQRQPDGRWSIIRFIAF